MSPDGMEELRKLYSQSIMVKKFCLWMRSVCLVCVFMIFLLYGAPFFFSIFFLVVFFLFVICRKVDQYFLSFLNIFFSKKWKNIFQISISQNQKYFFQLPYRIYPIFTRCYIHFWDQRPKYADCEWFFLCRVPIS